MSFSFISALYSREVCHLGSGLNYPMAAQLPQFVAKHLFLGEKQAE